jgi:hypothetical protein
MDEVREAEAEGLLPGAWAMMDEPQSEPVTAFRYGEIMFEESGRAVPYIIVPDTPEGRDPKYLVQ